MLKLRNVSFGVDGRKILNDISLTMEDSRFIVVTDPNDGGRSTLAKLIMEIEKPTEGEILFNGEDITAMSTNERAKQRIDYAFQQPPRSKGVSMRKLLSLARGKDLDEETCYSYLTDVGLYSKNHLNRDVDAPLSRGEVKRIEIANIFARDLKLSIFDKPEADIDLWSFTELVEVFQKLQRESRQSIILMSHQERIVQLAGEIIIIESGAIKTEGKRDNILPSLMSEFDSCELGRQVGQIEQMERNLLKTVADTSSSMPGSAFSLRKNGTDVERHSTEHVKVLAETDKPGINVIMDDNTMGESIHIPVILTDSGVRDMIYSDFCIGEGADVEIVAGYGIHNDDCDTSQHNGIHVLHIGRNASIAYTEKYYGEGNGNGGRILNPTTVIHMEEGSFARVDMSRIKGVDSTFRRAEASSGATAKLAINEKLITHGEQKAHSDATVNLNGEDSVVRIISRSVGKDTSVQAFHPIAVGNNRSRVHIQYDSIIMGKIRISPIPEIVTDHVDAEIIHEAAIGKINNDQLIKLQTFGLGSEEAEKAIVDGFLK